MLVENKFFFISLPRCASTSFMASCVKNNLEIKHYREDMNIENQLRFTNRSLENVTYDYFQSEFMHSHESLNSLIEKFGDNYEIISIKRNEHERFISLWQHILHEMDLKEHFETFDICKNLTLNDILFYNSDDLVDDISLINTVQKFIERNKLSKITTYGKNMLNILIKPYSDYHHHNKKIIWFDIDKISELEKWVSSKLNIDFKMIKINSSKKYKNNLILDQEFKTKYDSIYKIFDEIKILNTVI